MKPGLDHSAIRLRHFQYDLRRLNRIASFVELRGILLKTLPVHPALWLDMREPVLCRGNPS